MSQFLVAVFVCIVACFRNIQKLAAFEAYHERLVRTGEMECMCQLEGHKFYTIYAMTYLMILFFIIIFCCLKIGLHVVKKKTSLRQWLYMLGSAAFCLTGQFVLSRCSLLSAEQVYIICSAAAVVIITFCLKCIFGKWKAAITLGVMISLAYIPFYFVPDKLMFFNGMTTYIVIACGITALPDFLAKYFFY